MNNIITAAIAIIIFIFLESKFPYSSYSEMEKVIFRALLPLLIASGIIINTQSSFSVMITSAIILCAVADIVLLKNFYIGSFIFVLVHALLLTAIIIKYPIFNFNQIISLIIISIIVLVSVSNLFYTKVSIVQYAVILLYIGLLITQIWRSYCIAQNGWSIQSIFLLLGCILFLLCDIQVIYLETIGKHVAYQQINHGLYYGALILLALSCGV